MGVVGDIGAIGLPPQLISNALLSNQIARDFCMMQCVA